MRKPGFQMMISEHNPSKTSSSASQSIIQRKSSSFCSSPYTIFQSEKEKGTMKFLKIRREPIIIDRVQEAIALILIVVKNIRKSKTLIRRINLPCSKEKDK